MVDALRAAHRALRPGGMLVDARPDASRATRLLAGGRVRGHLRQSSESDADDAAADAAVTTVLADGLFRPVRSGHLWHSSSFADLRELDDFLAGSLRYGDYRPGTRRALLPFRAGPIRMRRAIRFSVLRRLP